MNTRAERWTTRAAAALNEGHVFLTSAVPGIVLTVVTRHDDDFSPDRTWYANLTVTPHLGYAAICSPGVSTGPGMLGLPAASPVHILDGELTSA
jgi:hypothetical protein